MSQPKIKGARKPRTCKTCGAHRASNFGFAGEKPTHCTACRIPGQINVYKKTCSCGSGIACTYKEPNGGSKRYCTRCKPENADHWSKTGRVCSCGSGKRMVHGRQEDDSPISCDSCKKEDHTHCFRNVRTCRLCDTGIRANYALKGTTTRIACKSCAMKDNFEDYVLSSRPPCACGSGLHRSHAIGKSWALVACRACKTDDHWSPSAVRSAKRRADLKAKKIETTTNIELTN